jgi:HEPN domain-containing protein
VNRRELKELSNIRLREARVLYRARCWDGSYYLAGYAVECALKACIAKATLRYDFPAKDRVIGSHTHSLGALVNLAGLELIRKARYEEDQVFQEYWDAAVKWSEKSRYERILPEVAKELLIAVSGKRHGVIPWIKRHW